VYDKTGLVDLAKELAGLGWELVASGGTSGALAEAGVAHREVSELTGVPEMLGGRVKTLHPAVHGGILADRSKPEHLADLEAHGIVPIDLVVCNLYPFASNPSIEMIDVGGPTMVRAAAKNHAHVGILVDPADYEGVLCELRSAAELSADTRRRLARAAFAHTAAYDAAIVEWFDATSESDGESFPPTLHLTLPRARVPDVVGRRGTAWRDPAELCEPV
jgi:phosphoribosylaminoimidazolecarboxamide formyltransferase/IMP cyclohydrolase